MFVRMIDVFCGVYPAPPDESGGYRMIDVFGDKLSESEFAGF
jgi:hypothetical protein